MCGGIEYHVTRFTSLTRKRVCRCGCTVEMLPGVTAKKKRTETFPMGAGRAWIQSMPENGNPGTQDRH